MIFLKLIIGVMSVIVPCLLHFISVTINNNVVTLEVMVNYCQSVHRISRIQILTETGYLNEVVCTNQQYVRECWEGYFSNQAMITSFQILIH